MAIERSRRNAFEAVCELASEERWCWKIFCTTCGHMHFRYAFLELSDRKHPDVDGWVTGKSRYRAMSRILGALPRPFEWSAERQKILADTLADASIRKIASSAIFPDWLGYLGLALLSTKKVEASEHRITHAWVPQLQELCQSGPEVVEKLQSIHDDESRVLRWEDLEMVEGAIGRQRFSSFDVC